MHGELSPESIAVKLYGNEPSLRLANEGRAIKVHGRDRTAIDLSQWLHWPHWLRLAVASSFLLAMPSGVLALLPCVGRPLLRRLKAALPERVKVPGDQPCGFYRSNTSNMSVNRFQVQNYACVF
jgi:hypothetical protein